MRAHSLQLRDGSAATPILEQTEVRLRTGFDFFDDPFQAREIANEQRPAILADEPGFHKRGELAGHLLAIGADLTCDVGVLRCRINACRIAHHSSLSREAQQLGMDAILHV